MFHDVPEVYAGRGSPKIMFLDGVHRPCTFLGILVAQLAELVFLNPSFGRTLLIIKSISHLLGKTRRPQLGRDLLQTLSSVLGIFVETYCFHPRWARSKS